VQSLRHFYVFAPILYGVFIQPRLYFRQLIFSSFKFVPGDNEMDVLYIALMIGFVALSIGLTYFFETLRRPK